MKIDSPCPQRELILPSSSCYTVVIVFEFLTTLSIKFAPVVAGLFTLFAGTGAPTLSTPSFVASHSPSAQFERSVDNLLREYWTSVRKTIEANTNKSVIASSTPSIVLVDVATKDPRFVGTQKPTSTIAITTTSKIVRNPSATVRATSTPVAPVTPVFSTTTTSSTITGTTIPLVSPTTTKPTTALSVQEEDANTKARNAVVNILCITQTAGSLRPISGSGVVIDPRGVILTNAHIAQYLLLKDFTMPNFIECIARVGSPARAKYRLTPLYLSPTWIERNYKNITESNPKGTGEDDYALLLITENIDHTPFADSLRYLSPDITSDISVGASYIAAGYPAGFLGGATIQQDLFAVSAVSLVREVFTFENTTADLFSIGGTVVAQHGSSGGAVVNDKGELAGLIVTATEAPTTAERDLRAITLGHVNRSIQKSTGSSLSSLLAGDLAPKAAFFQSAIAPRLTGLLIGQILGQQ